MKRICDLQPGEKIMYLWKWYLVLEKKDEYFIIQAMYGTKTKKKIAATSQAYVQYEPANSA